MTFLKLCSCFNCFSAYMRLYFIILRQLPNLLEKKLNRHKKTLLRTVPTFVTTHTFCASRDTRVSYVWYLLRRIFYNYAEKAEFSKCFWYPKRKLGGPVNMHFSEIIKFQFGKKRHALLCILLLFRIIVA